MLHSLPGLTRPMPTRQAASVKFAATADEEAKQVFIVMMTLDPENSVDRGKSREEVLKASKARTEAFKRKLEIWAKANKLEQTFEIKNVLGALGCIIVETTPSVVDKIKKMKEVSSVAENREVRLID